MTTPLNTASKFSSSSAGALLALAALMAPGFASAQGGPQRDDQPQAQHQPSRQDKGKGSDKGSNRGQDQRGNSNEHRDSKPTNTAKQNDRATNQHYDFGQNDRSRLQTHYRSSINKVDRDKRPNFQAGHEIPRAYRAAITPAPELLRRRLPAPPSGYQIGYYQGYTVVYDPTTFVILSLIDLLS